MARWCAAAKKGGAHRRRPVLCRGGQVGDGSGKAVGCHGGNATGAVRASAARGMVRVARQPYRAGRPQERAEARGIVRCECHPLYTMRYGGWLSACPAQPPGPRLQAGAHARRRQGRPRARGTCTRIAAARASRCMRCRRSSPLWQGRRTSAGHSESRRLRRLGRGRHRLSRFDRDPAVAHWAHERTRRPCAIRRPPRRAPARRQG